MNQLQPYDADFYVLPTSRKALPSNLTHSDREQIDIAFENHPANVRRNAVATWVGVLCATFFVGKVVTVGFNAPVFAVCCGVAFWAICYARRNVERNNATQRLTNGLQQKAGNAKQSM